MGAFCPQYVKLSDEVFPAIEHQQSSLERALSAYYELDVDCNLRLCVCMAHARFLSAMALSPRLSSARMWVVVRPGEVDGDTLLGRPRSQLTYSVSTRPISADIL